MNDIQQLATILLIGRVIAVLLMLRVLYKQTLLIRANNPPQVQGTRYALFGFALAALLYNAVPIWVDSIALFDPAYKTSAQTVTAPGLAYTLSSMIGSNIFALFFTYLYKEDHSKLRFEIRNNQGDRL